MGGTHPLDQILKMDLGGRAPRLDGILDLMHATGSRDLQPLLRALTDRERVAHRVIVEWLTGQGYEIGDSAVYAYRKARRPERWCAVNGITIEAVA